MDSPPSVHGLTSDAYATTTDVDNIYHQLDLAGISFKDYYEGEAGGCNVRLQRGLSLPHSLLYGCGRHLRCA